MRADRHTPNSEFAQEVASVPGGDVVNKCIQCGLCTASCMVASVSADYKPRQLIQKILLGMRDEVLASPLPWLCMTCRMCEERCQEDVSPAEVMKAVRLLAAMEGNVPAPFRTAIDTVLADGWMLKDSYSDFNEEEREDLGLDPDLRWNSEFTKRLREKYFQESELN